MKNRQKNLAIKAIFALVAILVVALAQTPQFALADGDPLDDCKGDYVVIEKMDSDGNIYIEAECDPQTGNDWWKWALGLAGVAGVAAYSWNRASSGGSQSAGAGDSRL